MKKKEKLLPRIMASIALIAIVLGIVGTGVLIVFESVLAPSPSSSETLSQEDLQKLMSSFSGTTASGTTASGAINIPDKTLSGSGS